LRTKWSWSKLYNYLSWWNRQIRKWPNCRESFIFFS